MFYNLDNSKKPKGFWDLLKWKLSFSQPKWPLQVKLRQHDIPPLNMDENNIRVSYVGHATFLIQYNKINILTDPVWSNRASPFSFVGPKRVIKPGIKFNNLPSIDIVLISHNHYDHLDLDTLKNLYLRYNPVVIAPLGNDKIINQRIPKMLVKTLNWGGSIIEKGLNINLEPAQHWSARWISDKNKALWGTFLIKTGKGDICFIGDTGYSDTIFKDIAKKYNNILLSLIPIGAFEPRWFMKDVHINPEEAVLIHQDLQTKYSISSHFNVFQLADEKFNQADTELKQARHKYGIKENIFILPNVGEVFKF